MRRSSRRPVGPRGLSWLPHRERRFVVCFVRKCRRLAAGLRSSTTPELAEQLEAHRGVPDKPFATIFAHKALTWRAIPIVAELTIAQTCQPLPNEAPRARRFRWSRFGRRAALRSEKRRGLT